MSELALHTLEARGLIRLATLQPEIEYLFRHALLQDAAYESLLRQERRALHQVVGQALEQLYPERVGELAAVLARHFELAGDTEKAITYLISAATFAAERNAISEGFDLYSRAWALLPLRSPDDDTGVLRRRIDIALGRARTGFTFLPESEAMSVIEPAIGDAEQLGDLRLEADIHLTIAVLRQFKGQRPDTSPNLKRSLERVSEIAAELGDPLIAALPDSIIGLFQIFSGSIREGIAALERVGPLLAQKRDYVGSSFADVALAMGHARLGQFGAAEKAARRASELAESGDVVARLDALIGEATVRSVRGDLDQAVPLAMKCTQLAEQVGAVACVVASNLVLGDAYMRKGEFGDAKIAFERGAQVADAVQHRVFGPSIAAYLRSNAASLGDFGPGAQTFDEALADTRGMGDRWGEANVIWKRAETEAKRPDGDRAQTLADYEAAATSFEQMGARPFHARVLRGWGTALRAAGRAQDGDQMLRAALALFDEMGITREAAALRSELAGG